MPSEQAAWILNHTRYVRGSVWLTTLSVWPDDRIKSCLILLKNWPKCSHIIFHHSDIIRNSLKSHQIFGLLLLGNLLPITCKNSPIWSHCLLFYWFGFNQTSRWSVDYCNKTAEPKPVKQQVSHRYSDTSPYDVSIFSPPIIMSLRVRIKLQLFLFTYSLHLKATLIKNTIVISLFQ